jgi:phosphoribosylglycinamide formyltransferase-1
VPVKDGDTAATLSARIRREELRAYPLAVRLFAEGRLRIDGDRVRVAAGGARRDEAAVASAGSAGWDMPPSGPS